jgi:hypothetical protein
MEDGEDVEANLMDGEKDQVKGIEQPEGEDGEADHERKKNQVKDPEEAWWWLGGSDSGGESSKLSIGAVHGSSDEETNQSSKIWCNHNPLPTLVDRIS